MESTQNTLKEILVHNSEIDFVGVDIEEGERIRYFCIKGFGVKFIDNDHKFHIYDTVRITIQKVKADAHPR